MTVPNHSLRQHPDGRVLLSTGTHWEARMGYSRAVRVGPWVLVAGCLGIEEDGSYSPSLTRQSARALERITAALEAFGGALADVVRIRIYTTDVDRWEEIADAVGPAFREAPPANVLLGVAGLADPAALVEIEVDGWLGE